MIQQLEQKIERIQKEYLPRNKMDEILDEESVRIKSKYHQEMKELEEYFKRQLDLKLSE